ncbi:MAG: hypothetical protein WB660_09320 [Candidatus Sulfotelmatobacter sp.]
MSKLSAYILAFAACLGTTAVLANSKGNVTASPAVEARMAGDGAFRDGFYLGKRAGESGQELRPAIGRWSTESDRSMFTAGYHRGYDETLAAVQASGVSKTP